MIQITKGNALDGPFTKKTVLIHTCNDLGIMGAGIAGSIRQKYPHVNNDHIRWYEDYFNGEKTDPFVLGQIQICYAEENFYICNAIAQRDIGVRQIDGEEVIPAKLECLHEAFLRLRGRVREAQKKDNIKIDVRAPLLSCGLAGSSIDKVYPIAAKVFDGSDFDFTFYAFSDKDFEELKSVHDGAKP